MNPNRYDIWNVKHTAGVLSSQSMLSGYAHLTDGILRLQFNREVVNYAKRIINDVEFGHKTPEQGMDALTKELRSLIDQSRAIDLENRGMKVNVSGRLRAYDLNQMAAPNGVSYLSAFNRIRSATGPDPGRLLRFVHAQQQRQQLERSEQKAISTAPAAPRPAPIDKYKMFPPEQWPTVVELYDPGFYIVPNSTTLEKLQAQLFTSPTPAVIAKFRALNPGLDQIKAGQMIVLSDPENYQCTDEDARLMAAARRVNEALADLSPEEADFMVRHREEIETFLTRGSTSIGIGEAIFADNLKTVGMLFRKIDDLHTSSFQKHGHLRSAEFFSERKRLLAQLDTQLTSMTKKGIGFPDHPKLKTALGISSRSLVHRWGRAGDYGMNSGYATHLAGVARASKYLKYGGYVGIAIGGGASYMKVQDVCVAGNTEACKKVKYAEGGSFVGTVGGGALGSFALVGSTGVICAALGVPTLGAGTLVCGIVVVGAGSFAAGIGLAMAGEKAGELIYEKSK
ncbi:hypothetical protein RHM65_23510 [Pseudomonas sp. CCI4.2]|uniref:hypothetical protein n=1 Tax=Pseudomonas sp. CCI4.2 TaxID=3048620 RepID=UPI002AC8B89E|nr:hypothetical protein [Pseudomonas sp. CCI4.2]MEB0092098.1 hypothetical protein [Pseudomonas sp. CCI4.2]WPX53697.1 hypothetical protein RHM65_23510 [Pseudomonas sp. CCI4.2]